MIKTTQQDMDRILVRSFHVARRWEQERNADLRQPDVCLMGWITYDKFTAMLQRLCEGLMLRALDEKSSPEFEGCKICVSYRLEEGMMFGNSQMPLTK